MTATHMAPPNSQSHCCVALTLRLEIPCPGVPGNNCRCFVFVYFRRKERNCPCYLSGDRQTRCARTLNVRNFRAFRLTSGTLRHRRVVSTTDLTKLTRYNSVRPVDCVHSSARHSALCRRRSGSLSYAWDVLVFRGNAHKLLRNDSFRDRADA